MSSAPGWPALAGALALLPFKIRYERGVWGKVHGQPSDYRWIARSAGFDASAHPERLHLGHETSPVTAQYWRVDQAYCYAIGSYPSRAVDAVGRSGFVEKQVLQWKKLPGAPVALIALALLHKVAKLNEAVWWEERSRGDWSSADFHLRLDSAKFEPVPVERERVERLLEKGLTELRERTQVTGLAAFYQALLDGEPAALGGLDKPLRPVALAGLLLPLQREQADRTSLAGWLPGSGCASPDPDAPWNAVVCREGGSPRSAGDAALAMARRIYGEVAPARELRAPVGARLELSAPDPGAPLLMADIFDFASQVERRWLARDWLADRLPPELRPQDRTLLRAWPAEVEQRRPAYVDVPQWEVKVDLLRALAFALEPSQEMLDAVGWPTSGKVATLHFAESFDCHARGELRQLGRQNVERLIDEARRCGVPVDALGLAAAWSAFAATQTSPVG